MNLRALALSAIVAAVPAIAQTGFSIMDEPSFFQLALGEPSDFGSSCNSSQMHTNGSGAILMEFKYNYTEACYNLADMYGAEIESHQGWAAPNGTCSWWDDHCDNEWRAIRPDAYDPAANYSVVSFIPSLISPRLQEQLDVDEISLQVFEGEDCEDVSPDRPYRQWSNCEFGYERHDCSEIPFSVASIRVGYNVGENSSDGCVAAAEQGEGSRSVAVSLLGMLTVVTTTGYMVYGL